MTIFISAVGIISFLIYLTVRNSSQTPSASSVSKEQVKSILLRVTQASALIAGFGIAFFSNTVNPILEYLNLNFDAGWTMVVGLIDIFLGLTALFKTEGAAAAVRFNRAQGVSASSMEAQKLIL